ncbi:MAG: hypothetical protein IJL09_04335 [Lachnospiraceae bacterium]|nr:hypothetical protein [Lachnospiraceae bacterium]
MEENKELNANALNENKLNANMLSETELGDVGGGTSGSNNKKAKCKIGTIDEEKEDLEDLLLAQPGA